MRIPTISRCQAYMYLANAYGFLGDDHFGKTLELRRKVGGQYGRGRVGDRVRDIRKAWLTETCMSTSKL